MANLADLIESARTLEKHADDLAAAIRKGAPKGLGAELADELLQAAEKAAKVKRWLEDAATLAGVR